jgi:hypothetical protein
MNVDVKKVNKDNREVTLAVTFNEAELLKHLIVNRIEDVAKNYRMEVEDIDKVKETISKHLDDLCVRSFDVDVVLKAPVVNHIIFYFPDDDRNCFPKTWDVD